MKSQLALSAKQQHELNHGDEIAGVVRKEIVTEIRGSCRKAPKVGCLNASLGEFLSNNTF